MKAKIAVATVSGRAYYHLVKELKVKGLTFLSLTPYEPIPNEIKVVVTTRSERRLIEHPNVMVFEEGTDPATFVNEVIRNLEGKRNHDTITVGIDPGKTFGVAVLSNGQVLETTTYSSIEETVDAVLATITKTPAITHIVKVGDGAPEYTQWLLKRLDGVLPMKGVTIEIVSEAGTSRFTKETVHRRGLRDAMSAVKIAERRGRPFRREKGKLQ
jgi:hypothetical protein